MSVTTLGDLVNRLRLEASYSSSPATGLNQRDRLVYVLNRVQEELSLDYDWPGLLVDRDIPVVVGTRYYAYPSDLPFEHVNEAWLIHSTCYDRLPYGIGPEQLVLWNSNTGFRSWPIQRWMHNADSNLFEVWPIASEAPPATSTTQAAAVRFRGTKLLPWMVADSDVCVMPATAIVLYAAAEILAYEGAKDAEMKIDKAKEYLRRLRVRQSTTKSRPFVMGSGASGRPGARPGLDYIPPGYGKGPG